MGPASHFTVVTLPAYNAEGTLERTVGALPAGTADHLLLVDDASPDGTVDIAHRLGIDVRVHDRNRGYGANQKTCYREALELGATVIVLLHPDYQYDPSAVPALIAPIVAGVADFTFGSRFACAGDPRAGGMPLYRYWGNRFSTVAENLLLGTHFTEMHSGMKAYSRRFLESVPFELYSDGFVFDTEILVAAVLGGYRIQEVAIPTRYTRKSSIDQRAPVARIHPAQRRGLLAGLRDAPPRAPSQGSRAALTRAVPAARAMRGERDQPPGDATSSCATQPSRPVRYHQSVPMPRPEVGSVSAT